MDAKEASKLQEGQRVIWNGDKKDQGTFCFHDDNKTSIWIRWDVSGTGWIHYNDTGKIETTGKFT